MELNSTFWNERYRQSETGWDIGEISRPLKTYFDQLRDDRLKILIPGGGNGYEAEYLFDKGFHDVYLLDWASESLSRFQQRNPDLPPEHLIMADFFEYQGAYDLIIEQTFFCAIDPKLRGEYARHVHSLLKDGGRLVGVLFNDPLYDDHPPFGGNKEEYVQYFEPYFELKHFEECYNSIEPRAGRELFINLKKKDAGQN